MQLNESQTAGEIMPRFKRTKRDPMPPATHEPMRDTPPNVFESVHATALKEHSAEVLVYRSIPLQEEPLLSPYAQRWIVGVISLVTLVFLCWTLRKTFPELNWDQLPKLWTKFVQELTEKEFTWDTFFATLYPVTLVLAWGGPWLWARQLKLYITPQGLRQEHRLPLGLHHLFGQNWQLPWSEIKNISTRHSTVPGGFASHLGFAEIVIQPHRGRQRVLRPAFWSRRLDPKRKRIKPVGSSSPLHLRIENPWNSPENNAQLAQAFSELRLVQAIQQFAPAPGFKLPWPGTKPLAGSDLNRQPLVLTLFGAALLVFITGLGLMVAAPNIHLHATPDRFDRIFLGLGTLAVWAMGFWWWLQRQSQKPAATHAEPSPSRDPLSKPALGLAALVWVGAVAFATEPLLAHAALLGRNDQSQSQRFVIGNGWATAQGPNAEEIPPIELPPSPSPLAVLKSGYEINITTTQGRFGLWVYDDAPLRDLANNPRAK